MKREPRVLVTGRGVGGVSTTTFLPVELSKQFRKRCQREGRLISDVLCELVQQWMQYPAPQVGAKRKGRAT